MTSSEKDQLTKYLIESMEKKKLQRVKDVNYDMKNGVILNINGLSYNTTKKRFTFKNREKKKRQH